MEEEVYYPPAYRGARSSERHFSSGLTGYEQETGGSPHAPNVRRRPPQATRVHGHELPRPSVLAGLAGLGRGVNRIFDWINHVEPGIPDGDQPPSIAAL